jgi:hypothetical protein
VVISARTGRRLIERIGLTEAADTADIRQALFKRREAAIRAAIFAVIGAPVISLNMNIGHLPDISPNHQKVSAPLFWRGAHQRI